MRVDSLPHRKWRGIQQQPGTAGPGNMLGCCLIYIHFLWGKLSTRTVVVSYLCINQNQKNQPNVVLYLVWRSKIFLSVATSQGGRVAGGGGGLNRGRTGRGGARWRSKGHEVSMESMLNPVRNKLVQEKRYCAVLVLRMAHRKWRETKQQPSLLPGLAVLGCCLVSIHFLLAILSTSTVQSWPKKCPRLRDSASGPGANHAT